MTTLKSQDGLTMIHVVEPCSVSEFVEASIKTQTEGHTVILPRTTAILQVVEEEASASRTIAGVMTSTKKTWITPISMIGNSRVDQEEVVEEAMDDFPLKATRCRSHTVSIEIIRTIPQNLMIFRHISLLTRILLRIWVEAEVAETSTLAEVEEMAVVIGLLVSSMNQIKDGLTTRSRQRSIMIALRVAKFQKRIANAKMNLSLTRVTA